MLSVNNWDYGWADLPQDVLKAIVWEWKVTDQLVLARVCKSWHNLVSHNSFGQYDLGKIGLQAVESCSWRRVYIDSFVKATQIVALDTSASMNAKRTRNALQKISQLSKEVPIEQAGIVCVAFAEECVEETLKSEQGVLQFFKRKHRIGQGTDINNLFKTIGNIHKRAIKENPQTSCHVTIISDFEDDSTNIQRLVKDNLTLQFINVGKPASPYVEKITQEYEKWAIEEAKRLSLEQYQKDLEEYQLRVKLYQQEQEKLNQQRFKAVLKGRSKTINSAIIVFKGSQSAKKRHRQRFSQPKAIQGKNQERAPSTPSHARQRASKRKAEEITPPPTIKEVEIPLSLSLVDTDNWQPLPKKRRITVEIQKEETSSTETL